MKYRKKPVVVEAWEVEHLLGIYHENPNSLPPPILDGIKSSTLEVVVGAMLVRTLEGTMRAEGSDYIIRGVKGELYPCKPDIFAATYDAAE